MKFSYQSLQNAIADVLKQKGIHEDDAKWVAYCLVETESRGVYSHGVHLIGTYMKGLKHKVTNPDAKIEIVSDSPCAVRIDGHSGMGQCVMRDVTDLLIERARQYGCAAASVTHTAHFGAGLIYARRAIDAGMIVTLHCNAPSMLAPFGAKKPYFGTNPITYGMPAGKLPPFLLDMASSMGAANKLLVFKSEGKPAPAGWGIDRDGNPSTDPEEIFYHGALSPFGGVKGSGLAGWVGMLSTLPCGAAYAPGEVKERNDVGEVPNFGVYMQLTDVSKFMPIDEFRERADEYLGGWLALPPAKEGGRVLYPGYLEEERANTAKQNGIELLESTEADLRRACTSVGLNLDDYLD